MLGNYPKEVKRPHDRITVAKPGAAATLMQRNLRGQDEIDVKPITNRSVDASAFKPGKYLKPHEEHSKTVDKPQDAAHLNINKLLN
jgi:hypothetical protein